ncbi:MAG: fatty acyl-CoA reductase [Marinobacter sp.]|nr:fatty acyl-CoA reductase [Marinobacter sp.]
MDTQVKPVVSSRIIATLTGKRILLTGASGFLGKVVLEKLLRTVPDIGLIYLPMRANRKFPNAEDRFRAEVLGSSVFDRLRRDLGDAFEARVAARIRCLPATITASQLGLTDDAYQALAGSLDAIINSAASVNFRESLERALEINTLCLDNLVTLTEVAGGIPLLQVSTCYVNGKNPGDAREAVVAPASGRLARHAQGYYEVRPLIARLQAEIRELSAAHQDPDAREQALIALGQAEANELGWTDTYTFTKWLGEQCLLESMQGRTLTIVRPAIIESALEEPLPGWIEGVKVADAVIMGYARGKVVVFPGQRGCVLDVIPVDLVANSILMALAEALQDPGEQRIYQSCSGASNPITLGQFIDLVIEESRRNHQSYPRLFKRPPRLPFVAVDATLFGLLLKGSQLPLQVIQRLLRIREPEAKLKLLESLATTQQLAALFGFYTAADYVFHNDRLMALAQRMSPVDRALFPVDPSAIDWANYLQRIHLAGLDRYSLTTRRSQK